MALGFAASILAFNKKVERQISNKIIAIACELFTEVVTGSPVDKGVLINNWYAGTGKVRNGSYSETMTNKQGMASLNQIASLKSYTGFIGRDGAVSISNSTPYGFRAEYAGWPQPVWSGKVGPYAMIAKAFIKVVPKYKRP
jgi:hypothetical protein